MRSGSKSDDTVVFLEVLNSMVNCRINKGVSLSNVKISNHVMIARESIILGKMHEFVDSEIPMEMQGNRETKLTIIEADVWIGLRAIIFPGIKISKGSIIGAGAEGTKSTESYGIYAGVPAQFLKSRM